MHRLFTAFFLIGILGALVQLLGGDLQAPAVYVSPGATILGGKFAIAPVTPV